MTQPRATTATLLFTDLVNAPELLQRAGDQQAQRIFQAHHRLLNRFGAAHAAQEVKWLGDGFLMVFTSPTDAVRCALAMQQEARRRAASARLAVRVGLHVGDTPRAETDYFGTPVAIARRLCVAAQAGQVLCSATVCTLLADQPTFTFHDCGALALAGLTAPVPACEVVYQPDQPLALLRHTPFVGRTAELAQLTARLREARTGSGGLVMLAGEPGIGKTRTLEEFVEIARMEGALVLSGRCYEGDAARPYGPFVEALAEHARSTEPEALRGDLGAGAAPLARLVPALREPLPDIPEPVALQPDEERVRLLDAVAQFLIALAARAPVVLVLDDLHWADAASIALLRHVARGAARNRLLLVGAYRNVEVTLQPPLTDALGALPRETAYEHVALTGLGSSEVEELLEAVADQPVSAATVAAITTGTSGNPFFIREVLLHLVEEEKIVRREGQWMASLSIQQMGIPHGVRQVIQRRLARLSAPANRFLNAAAGFSAGVRFDVAARVAGLGQAEALDAIDEALGAQLLRPATDAETVDFSHALVRHTLYAALSPPRQVHLHRQIAATMEQVYGDRADEHAGEIAQHYRRSATLPGAERGVAHALIAADRAQATFAYDDVATFLRIALELLPQNDTRRPRLLGRLGLALSWALNFDEATRVMGEAGDLIAAAEGSDAAADYLAEAAMGLWLAGCQRGGWTLAAQGLRYIGDRRDVTWVRLKANDVIRREAEDPEHPGIIVDTPERCAMIEITERLSFSRSEEIYLGSSGFLAARSRQDILSRFGDSPFWLLNGGGEYRRSLPLWEKLVAQSQREGRIADTVTFLARLARCHNALGNFAAARAAYDRGVALAARLTGTFFQNIGLNTAKYNMQTAVDEGWEDLVGQEQTAFLSAIETQWTSAGMQAVAAHLYARLGRTEDSLFLLGALLPALERAPGWTIGYIFMACEAAATLWLLQRTDHVEVIERNLREKVLVLDFRWAMVDARLSMAHLCALQSRYDEAVEWFAQARVVLDEQGARPLRAIVDYDEALMYHRRGAAGDNERAHPPLDAALQQFRALGMPGWIRRADALRAQCVAEGSGVPCQRDAARAAGASAVLTAPSALADVTQATGVCILHHEGDFWTLTYDGTTDRLKDSDGLRYLAHLLRQPGQDFHVLDLMTCGRRAPGIARVDQNAAPLLDAQAKAEYRHRLRELRAELEEAERFNDAGRTERLQAESEALTEQLAAAVGLGGRDRQAASAAERARSTVTQRIKTAIKRIGQHHPSLADRLARRVKTGTFCVYDPDPAHPIVWEL